ncbi:McrC family protein [Verrucomicrobiales bacterium BCK34]|nr:McrC family protein [Verrucomicrobiales bacterium BCK34]
MLDISETVTIREFDVLFRDEGSASTVGTSIPGDDWDWLLKVCLSRSGPDVFRLQIREGKQCLQARNYVGSLETPHGLRIEILPKVSEVDEGIAVSRLILLKMLKRVLKLKMTTWKSAHLETLKQPLHEILISLFLDEVEYLVKKGIRSEYLLQRDEQPFLRGRLLVEQQLNRRPGAKPEFAIEYHEFLPDRPENRLIHSAVVAVSQWASSSRNQQRARTLRFQLDGIPLSTGYKQDFQKWSHDRGLIDYRDLRGWCELILNEQTPHTLAGGNLGMAFLFPMEMLFERYVAAILRRKLPSGYSLKEQAKAHSLVCHRNQNWFLLKPDLLVLDSQGRCLQVLDTKWKRLDSQKDDGSKKYGLSQSDFYQMAAYGQKYLGGEGEMFLIYPRSSRFQEPLDPFDFTDKLRLRVVPFDLERDELALPGALTMLKM